MILLQIFAAHSQRIIGLTKKGKDFFKLTSSLTESIRNIAVEDTKIWTGCEYIYNLYDNGQDTAFFMCRDQINALTVEHITRDTDYDVILACQDKCLRVVQGSTLVVEIPTLAPATAIASKGKAFNTYTSQYSKFVSSTAMIYFLLLSDPVNVIRYKSYCAVFIYSLSSRLRVCIR